MTIEIYIDIETIPTSRKDVRESVSAGVSAPANYKKAETIAEWMATEGEAKRREAVAKTALDGTWGEVICIGMAINDDPVIVLDRRSYEEEYLLRSFSEMLNGKCMLLCKSGELWQPETVWIGHNLIDFDLRFLWQRCKIIGVKLPFELPIGKPQYGRGPRIFDTMKEWAGYGNRVSQKNLELAFNIERSDPLLMGGADVFSAYEAGKIEDIKQHCAEDIRCLREIYRRMQ